MPLWAFWEQPLRWPAPHFTCATNNPDYIFLWHSKPAPDDRWASSKALQLARVRCNGARRLAHWRIAHRRLAQRRIAHRRKAHRQRRFAHPHLHICQLHSYVSLSSLLCCTVAPNVRSSWQLHYRPYQLGIVLYAALFETSQPCHFGTPIYYYNNTISE